MRARLLTASIVFLVALPHTALSQQTRAEVIAAAQAEKATRLRPYEPTRVERILQRVQRAFSGPPRGFYPWFGGILDGGLIAAGPGFRVPIGGSGAFDAQAAISIRNYRLAAATLTLPAMARQRVRARLQARMLDAPDLLFHGVGNGTTRADRTNYLYRPVTAGGDVAFVPVRGFELGGGLSYLEITSGGRVAEPGSPVPLARAPGLGTSPAYLVGTTYAAVDWRDGTGYNRRGGYYRVDWSSYAPRGGGASSFRRVDADLRQLIPIQRANWIIALRAAASTTIGDDGAVPFFLMPQLGGGNDHRGFPSWRFRDRHRVLYTAEYRWTPGHVVDMAVFHDAGKVAASRRDLDFSGLKHATGVGIRFHAPNATILRFEVARGSEGIRFITAFGPVF